MLKITGRSTSPGMRIRGRAGFLGGPRRGCPPPASTAVSAEKLPCLPPPVLRVSKIRRRPARRHPEPRFLKIAFDADRLLFRFGFWSWRGPSTFAEKQFLE